MRPHAYVLARNKYAYLERLYNLEDDSRERRDGIRKAFRVLFDAHELTEFQDRKLRGQLKPLRDCSQRDRIFL